MHILTLMQTNRLFNQVTRAHFIIKSLFYFDECTSVTASPCWVSMIQPGYAFCSESKSYVWDIGFFQGTLRDLSKKTQDHSQTPVEQVYVSLLDNVICKSVASAFFRANVYLLSLFGSFSFWPWIRVKEKLVIRTVNLRSKHNNLATFSNGDS